MGKNRKIKHLRKRKFLTRKTKKQLTNIVKWAAVFLVVVMISKIGNNVKKLYEKTDIENSKVEFYVNAANEISKGKAQVNWQELLAIDLVKFNKDLSNIRKVDVIDNGNMFIKKSNKSRTGYAIKPVDIVLKELDFTKKEKEKFYKELEGLKYVSTSGLDLSQESKYGKFIDELSAQAIENYKKYNIFPSVTVGQAILESGWGESELTIDSNNLFGIKADNRWDGEAISVKTGENYNDTIVASFRAYKSRSESLKDHAEFLSVNKRYTEHGVFEAKDYMEQAQALENAGYSTKENEKGEKIYADMLGDLIKKYNLQLLDHEAQIEK